MLMDAADLCTPHTYTCIGVTDDNGAGEEGGQDRRIPMMQALAVMRYLRYACVRLLLRVTSDARGVDRSSVGIYILAATDKPPSLPPHTSQLTPQNRPHPSPQNQQQNTHRAAEEEVNALVAAAAGFRQPLEARPVRFSFFVCVFCWLCVCVCGLVGRYDLMGIMLCVLVSPHPHTRNSPPHPKPHHNQIKIQTNPPPPPLKKSPPSRSSWVPSRAASPR